jgi:hypothetical protein
MLPHVIVGLTRNNGRGKGSRKVVCAIQNGKSAPESFFVVFHFGKVQPKDFLWFPKMEKRNSKAFCGFPKWKSATQRFFMVFQNGKVQLKNFLWFSKMEKCNSKTFCTFPKWKTIMWTN